MIISRTALVLGAIAASTALAACGGGSSGAGDTNAGGSPAPTATVTITEQPPASPVSSPPTGSSSTPSTPSAPHAAACTTGQLKLTLGAGQGTAGSTYQPIVFTNTGSAPCSLTGYPGVSFVDASGAQLGKSASRNNTTYSSVTVAASGQASALLRLPDPGVFSPGDCHETTATKLKVYPPNRTWALLVSDAADICTTKTGRTSIGPVHVGVDG